MAGFAEISSRNASQQNQLVTVMAPRVLSDQSSPTSKKFMLRITESSHNGEAVMFRLDGTLTEASCAELEALCSRYQESDGKIIQLDMAGVVFMNEESAKKLLELRSDRLNIINCSPFIETLLQSVDR